MIHLYTGNGKGKTTAAIGLAVRAAGRGWRVLFAQFLKSSESGELAPLKALGISVTRSTLNLGFTFTMDAAAAALCREEEARILEEVRAKVRCGAADLVVLDEVLDALDTGMLGEAPLRAFVEQSGVELALTGRKAPAWLCQKADYHSGIDNIKHPFDAGIPARTGIEF